MNSFMFPSPKLIKYLSSRRASDNQMIRTSSNLKILWSSTIAEKSIPCSIVSTNGSRNHWRGSLKQTHWLLIRISPFMLSKLSLRCIRCFGKAVMAMALTLSSITLESLEIVRVVFVWKFCHLMLPSAAFHREKSHIGTE